MLLNQEFEKHYFFEVFLAILLMMKYGNEIIKEENGNICD